MTDRLRMLRAVLGGEIHGRTLNCATVGHPAKDRGTSYTDSPHAPDGLLVCVRNGRGRDDDLEAKERALEILGEEPVYRRNREHRSDPIADARRRAAARAAAESDRADAARRQAAAQAIWDAGLDPRGTVVEHYLRSRGLVLLDDVAGDVLRFVRSARWDDGTAPLMVALLRDVRTGEAKAIHRTALTDDGRKRGRKMLGPAAGCAVMLDAFETITTGLAVGEGIETCLAARQLGIRPAWALCSTSGVRSMPVLSGIDTITLLQENDESRASERACRETGLRWHRAGHSVEIIKPRIGKDLNDALMEGA